ncbi:hypothetical protein VZT92_023464 [Zoarces viviparus]|uniref:Uncharacterized protein n=1 Tax=Zoarces viviparus TaxID=48416 RepID=A0AAW1E6A7_ZOAVI
MLSRHEEHPVSSMIEWRKAAALRGALFEGRGSNDLSSLCGLQWCRTPAVTMLLFRLGLRVPWREGITGSGVALVTLEHQDRTGPLTGRVEAEDIDGSPIARWPL